MATTAITQRGVAMMRDLGVHLVTYGLPTPEEIRLSVGTHSEQDSVQVRVETDELATVAAAVLHWHKTLWRPNINIRRDNDNDAGEISILGHSHDYTLNLTVIAHPVVTNYDEQRAEILTGTEALTWLHQIVAAALTEPKAQQLG